MLNRWLVRPAVLFLAATLLAATAHGAINATAVQCASEHEFLTRSGATLSRSDAWAAPKTGNLIVAGMVVKATNPDLFPVKFEPGFNIFQEFDPGWGPLAVSYAWKLAGSDDDEITISVNDAPNALTIFACEFETTGLDTEAPLSSAIELANDARPVRSFSTGSAVNGRNSLVIHLGAVRRGNAFNAPAYSDGTEQLYAPGNSSAPGIMVAATVSSRAAESATISTNDIGDPAVGAVLVFGSSEASIKPEPQPAPPPPGPGTEPDDPVSAPAPEPEPEPAPEPVDGGEPATPELELSVADGAVDVGGVTTLTWSGRNVDECSAGGGWSGSRAPAGSAVVGPFEARTTLTLSCSGPGGVVVEALSVAVRQQVTIRWIAPSENEDGSPLEDLLAYRIYYGVESGDYSDYIRIRDPGATSHTWKLRSGRHYVSMTAEDGEGNESAYSNEVVRIIE